MTGHLASGAVAVGAVLVATAAGFVRTRPAGGGGFTPASSTRSSRTPVRPAPRRAGTHRRPQTARSAGADGARWARRRDLAPLLGASGGPGRLALGELGGSLRRPPVLAAEPAQSVAVIGPTQSGKTTALAVPAILGWRGPVLAASVKSDLVRDTLAWRSTRGRVWCFDPSGATGLPQARWTPVSAAGTWAGARRVAADLTAVTRSEGTTSDGEFWYATAAKLLAPLLFAAAKGGKTMHDVVRWVDTQEAEEVTDILHAAGVPEAMQAARASWLRDDRTRSSVYTTAETVLEAFAEPGLVVTGGAGAAACSPDPDDTPPFGTPSVSAARTSVAQNLVTNDDIEPGLLLSGMNTLYVCAPAHDQRRLRAVFSALVERVLHAAFARSSGLGRPLDPPLLVVLDEAANIAPLRELDGLAATCAGHGVQLVTVWQDLAQIRARFGERAATVVNNHRAKLFLPGIADPATLDFASQLAGEQELTVPSVTVGPRGERTHSSSPQVRKLLPGDSLRRLPKGTAVLLYGSLPPVRLRLRPWFDDPGLAWRGRRSKPGGRPGDGYSRGHDGRFRRHAGTAVGRPGANRGPRRARRTPRPTAAGR